MFRLLIVTLFGLAAAANVTNSTAKALTAKVSNATVAVVSDEAKAKAEGDARAEAIVAKVEKKASAKGAEAAAPAKVASVPATAAIAAKAEKNAAPVVKETDPEDNFPTDWMNPNNVMKYDIDNDPESSRIAQSEADVEEHRKFNLQKVGLLQKPRSFRTANQILYIEDDQ